MLSPDAPNQTCPAVFTQKPALFQEVPVQDFPRDMDVSGLGWGTASVARVSVT